MLLLLAVLLLLGAFGCFYTAAKGFFKNPGRGLALLAAAVVLSGGAVALLHAARVEGF